MAKRTIKCQKKIEIRDSCLLVVCSYDLGLVCLKLLMSIVQLD